MRGFAVTMSTWAIEQQMDKIAEVVGLDPWAIRFINAYKDGDMKPHHKVVEDATLIEVMQAAAEMAGVDLPQEYKEMSSMQEVSHG
jgi:CO/xanthine dehydrogenase Mo-binding subunit